MANRLFQNVIHQMKSAVDRVIGVIDENGVVIACSELVRIGEIKQGIRDELAYSGETFVLNLTNVHKFRASDDASVFINYAYDSVYGILHLVDNTLKQSV